MHVRLPSSGPAHCRDRIGEKDDKDAARTYHEGPPSDPAEKRRTGRVGMAGFFGRTHELEVVRAALARAPGEQRPSAVVVDGEPGVGKSRLIDEASRNADRVAVSAYEPEMDLPFSLGHDLTRALARSSQAAEEILSRCSRQSPAAGGLTGRPCSRRPIARPVSATHSSSRSTTSSGRTSDLQRSSTTWCAGPRPTVIRWRSSLAVGGPLP